VHGVPRRTRGYIWPAQHTDELHQRHEPQFPRSHGEQGIESLSRQSLHGRGFRAHRQNHGPEGIFKLIAALMPRQNDEARMTNDESITNQRSAPQWVLGERTRPRVLSPAPPRTTRFARAQRHFLITASRLGGADRYDVSGEAPETARAAHALPEVSGFASSFFRHLVIRHFAALRGGGGRWVGEPPLGLSFRRVSSFSLP